MRPTHRLQTYTAPLRLQLQQHPAPPHSQAPISVKARPGNSQLTQGPSGQLSARHVERTQASEVELGDLGQEAQEFASLYPPRLPLSGPDRLYRAYLRTWGSPDTAAGASPCTQTGKSLLSCLLPVGKRRKQLPA